jgi:HSP20 family protein
LAKLNNKIKNLEGAMTLVRFNPVLSLFKEFDNLLNDVQTRNNVNYNHLVKVDAYEEDNKIILEVEIPGFKKDDVKITLEENMLTISGEKKLETEKKDRKYYFSERMSGSFSRSFTLDETIDKENISASFENGVLTITLNKIEPVKPDVKQIEIK